MLPFNKLLKEKNVFLTPSQRKLMQYILSHDDESIFLNVEDLAKKVDISVATVVRLSKALGFKGFPEFQKELRLLFRNKLTTTSRLQKTVKKVTNEGDVLSKVLQTDIHNIEETLKQISAMEFKQFVKAIDSAQRIIIVGLRSAYSLAIFLGISLEFLQKNVWVIQLGIGDMWDRLLGLGKGDLVIGISFPRYTKQTVEVLRFAKERGNNTLAITDSLISPLTQYADHVLTARYQMDSFVESFTAPLSLINAIVTALGVCSKKSTMKSLKGLEEIWERQQIYYNTPK
ncbi:MAG: MurR/RpiR family transcriptional regulator [Deltaproteobacteria bacterium]|nr:MurR/RpiR family transcriptional regulator [Deltaproteobacteria bacterium]